MPLIDLFIKVIRKVCVIVISVVRKRYYSKVDYRKKNQKIEITSKKIQFLSFGACPDDNVIKEQVVNRYLSKEFDYFGMNWRSSAKEVKSKQDMLKNLAPAHRAFSESLLSKITDNYIFLDWQYDCISGYKWDVSKYHTDSFKVVNENNGIDIKNPWETGRLQHLPQLAYYAGLKSEYKARLYEEFKNVVFDFYASNPYGMGVQWACTMDVAIRAANLILAYNMFLSIDKNLFDEEFDNIFSNLIFQHGKFIHSNLEKGYKFSNNHYLSNLCGLIFISSYLTNFSESLSFSVKEFFVEIKKQFHKDGSNFESSTAYHCLSSEMTFYTIALLIGFDKKYADYIEENLSYQLSRVYDFSKDIVAPDGIIVQIGDNDSGHFFNIDPLWKVTATGIHEDVLNNEALLSLMVSLFKENNSNITSLIVSSLSKKNGITYKDNTSSKTINTNLSEHLNDYPYFQQDSFSITTNFDNQKAELGVKYYPDFGLILWKNEITWVSIFFGQVGQCGVGGHSHNDKLSMIFYDNGKMVFGDPGSYTYTTNIIERNKYRSYVCHPFAVNIEDSEQEFLNHNTFAFSKQFSTAVDYVSSESAQIRLKTNGQSFIRNIRLEKNSISICTLSNKPFKLGHEKNRIFSYGYGRR
jgi:hypothetical protein